MNQPQSPETCERASKLIVRSEVLAVIRHLASLEDLPKQERFKLFKKLQEISNRNHVLDVLVKELERCTVSGSLSTIIELLMELGTIDYLQNKLWSIIQNPKSPDEIKDAANIILRHLGDPTDPNLYLEYLADPQGMIGRETIRMLEISTENPEALIDFLDFISSLNTEDQVRLLVALHSDYPSEYLVNIYIPLLESDPSPELCEHLVTLLGETKSREAAETLFRISNWSDDQLPVPKKLITKSLKQLQLAGAFHPEQEQMQPEKKAHPIVADSAPYQCYASLSDGIGNQGLLFSRQRANGDISMISVAINDIHGIIDCFGFLQLSSRDFHKIIEKFHEGSTKIKVSPEYCVYKLLQAEATNYEKAFRLPYEYRCWRPLLTGISADSPKELVLFRNWVKKEWYTETHNLYQHPDFSSWFLEQGDEPLVTGILRQAVLLTEDYLESDAPDMEDYFQKLEDLADKLVLALLKTPWRRLLINRLIETSYLLNCQNTHTFRNLAATEADKLQSISDDSAQLLTGFTRAYGRRCISEELLRLRTGNSSYDRITEVIDKLFSLWGF